MYRTLEEEICPLVIAFSDCISDMEQESIKYPAQLRDAWCHLLKGLLVFNGNMEPCTYSHVRRSRAANEHILKAADQLKVALAVLAADLRIGDVRSCEVCPLAGIAEQCLRRLTRDEICGYDDTYALYNQAVEDLVCRPARLAFGHTNRSNSALIR